MRRSLSLLVAVAMAASTMSLAPAQARTIQAPTTATTSDGASITEVRDRGDRRWKHRRHSDRHWNHRRHRDRHFSSQFYFPFPFFAPQRYSYAPRYRCHGRLIYGHDGRLHCVAY